MSSEEDALAICHARQMRGALTNESEDGSEDSSKLEYSVKEVIQPQVPLRLPCYDFTPVTTHSFGGSFLIKG